MLVVGLTGGIGSGKTAVSDRFAALGAPVIDTDLLSRELVAPGKPALQEIARAFGESMIQDNGGLDRAALGRIVFTDPAARRRLEAILHPRIRAAVRDRLAALRAPYAIVVIPLLFETGQQDLVDRVLVVDAPEAMQRQRVQQRDGLNRERIDQILAAQADRTTRLAGADEVIVNAGDLEELGREVTRLDRLYRELAAKN
jgi:dephospho-CoA kinase